MAGMISPIVLALTVAKALLVVEAVCRPRAGPQAIRSVTPLAKLEFPNASPSRRAKRPAAAGASKSRSLHLRLISMHVTSVLAQSASVAKGHVTHVSDASCLVVSRAMMAMFILSDASVVLFLLAKVHITNDSRTTACWERAIVWWSRFFGWVFLPITAFSATLTYPAQADPEGSFCHNDHLDDTALITSSDIAQTYGISISLMTIQFVLLLGLFVKPLLGRAEGTQSEGAVYRKVVLRNIICTIGMVFAYLVTMPVVILTYLRESSTSETTAQIREAATAMNSFAVLCFTEIALPRGFTSCLARCTTTVARGHHGLKRARTTAFELLNEIDVPASDAKVLPVEELPPEIPESSERSS